LENVDGLVALGCVINVGISVSTACSDITMKHTVRPSR